MAWANWAQTQGPAHIGPGPEIEYIGPFDIWAGIGLSNRKPKYWLAWFK